MSMIESGGRALTLEESVQLRRVYGLSMEGLLSGPADQSMSLRDIMRLLSTDEQQALYRIMYEIAELLRGHGQESPREDEPPPESPADVPPGRDPGPA